MKIEMQKCAVCLAQFPLKDCTPFGLVLSPLRQYMESKTRVFDSDEYICNPDLQKLRTEYLKKTMEEELGEITQLDEEVLKSLHEHELISQGLLSQSKEPTTFANRLSDKMAEFGGSWAFIILFGSILVFWISINTIALFHMNFDPFPYIFLNLVLSCVAALQAPVIMMSQNRQESKDRVRAEHDYKINLKAELEIRHLKSKLDQIASHQWRHLIELEETQVEILRLISQKK